MAIFNIYLHAKNEYSQTIKDLFTPLHHYLIKNADFKCISLYQFYSTKFLFIKTI